MGFLSFALRRPVSVLVVVISILIASIGAMKKMHLDIFPNLQEPMIYVAQPYGGLSPLQMEGYISSWYEFMFMFASGIKSIESRSIQSFTLVKLVYYPDTDMAQAMAEVEALVTRGLSFMPKNVEPPFILRFDAGSLPVGDIVLQSSSRTIPELQDMATYKIRPKFASLPGVSSPSPIGGNQRTIVYHANADKLQAYQISPEQVVNALVSGNYISPAGLVRIKDTAYLASNNGVPTNFKSLEDIVVLNERGATVSMRDIGWFEDSADILVGYALLDDKRTIYIPVTKRPSAATWTVVQEVKKNIPLFQEAVPKDVKVSYEFDQSWLVKDSLLDVIQEGLIGAFFIGLMVYLFLRDIKSACIVMSTIPLAVLTSLVCLWMTGQTINIMTLTGLALAIGVLVDESTVVIENFHAHMGRGKTVARAAMDSGRELITIKFIVLICVVSVFVPIFFMDGLINSLFAPLALGVCFAMLAAYLISQSFVPILVIKWLKPNISHGHENSEDDNPTSLFAKFKARYKVVLEKGLAYRKKIIVVYFVTFILIVSLLYKIIDVQVYPSVDNGSFKVRIDAPTGTRVETTELLTRKVLNIIKEAAGEDNINHTLSFIGNQPPTYALNIVYIWTSGPHEAIIEVDLNDKKTNIEELKDKIRTLVAKRLKDVSISFEPAGLMDQVLSLGASNPIQITIAANSIEEAEDYSKILKSELEKIDSIRDVRYGEAHDYPSLKIDVDRVAAGQLGVTVKNIYDAVAPAVYSTRFPVPNFWVDSSSGIAYQVQVEIPQFQIQTVEDIKGVPIIQSLRRDRNVINLDEKNFPFSDKISGLVLAQNSQRAEGPYVRDLAKIGFSKEWGEPHRINNQRICSLTANFNGHDLLKISKEVDKAIKRVGERPRGLKTEILSQIKLLMQTMSALKLSLILSLVTVLLVLAANFQSFILAIVSLITVPIVMVGALLMLILTGSSLNIQSYLGIVMAIGVSVSNTILLVTMSEELREKYKDSTKGALEGALRRLRPILMTGIAMIAGMIPMALALGTSGSQLAPLARAIIGGMLASLVGTLYIAPIVISYVRRNASFASKSLDPDDENSEFYSQ